MLFEIKTRQNLEGKEWFYVYMVVADCENEAHKAVNSRNIREEIINTRELYHCGEGVYFI